MPRPVLIAGRDRVGQRRGVPVVELVEERRGPVADEPLREVLLDVEEGADLVMVKPAGPYLDVIRQVRDAVRVPVVAYQVSGEFSLIKAAAARGWIDERAAVLETLTAIHRAGADLVISYFAPQVARWLRG